MNNSKKRHHYIPQFYLKKFIDPKNSPYIWVYDKQGHQIIKSTSQNIAVEKHYFSLIGPDNQRDSNILENAFVDIEGIFSQVINKIMQEEPLTLQERVDFSSFVSLMFTRVPSFRENVETVSGKLLKKTTMILASNKEGFEELIERFQNDTGERIGMPVEELRQWVLRGRYGMTVDRQYSLEVALNQAEKLTELFNAMNWTFIKATEDYKFLTGDNPLYFCDPSADRLRGVGLLNKNVEVTVPLSKELCAFGSWRAKDCYIQGKNQMIKDLNRRTVIAAQRFVFASEKSDTLKTFVEKYQNSAPKMRVH